MARNADADCADPRNPRLVFRARGVHHACSYRTNHKKQIVTVHGLAILGNDSNNLEHLSGWKERIFTVTEGREVYRRETLHRFQKTKGLLRIDDIARLDKFAVPRVMAFYKRDPLKAPGL